MKKGRVKLWWRRIGVAVMALTLIVTGLKIAMHLWVGDYNAVQIDIEQIPLACEVPKE